MRESCGNQILDAFCAATHSRVCVKIEARCISAPSPPLARMLRSLNLQTKLPTPKPEAPKSKNPTTNAFLQPKPTNIISTFFNCRVQDAAEQILAIPMTCLRPSQVFTFVVAQTTDVQFCHEYNCSPASTYARGMHGDGILLKTKVQDSIE